VNAPLDLPALLAAARSGTGGDGAAAARRAAVIAAHASGALRTPRDELLAARILLASDDATHVQLAETLALRAMAREAAARPIAAAAFDRRRVLAGRPQKFGTQAVVRDGRRELLAVDPATTDSERAKWGLPSLAELIARGFDSDA